MLTLFARRPHLHKHWEVPRTIRALGLPCLVFRGSKGLKIIEYMVFRAGTDPSEKDLVDLNRKV